MSETTFLSAILFLLFALISGSLIQWLVSKVKAYKPPVSILWFAFGMLVCLIEVLVVPEIDNDSAAIHVDIDPEHPLGLLGIGIAEASRVRSSVLYYIVLPILLYDATQQISWHHFRKTLKTGLLLAIAGVIFQVAVVGLLMQYSFTRPAAASFVDRSAPGRMLGFLWRGPKTQPRESVMTASQIATTMTQNQHIPSFSFSMMTAAAVASTDPIAVISILEEMEAPAQFTSLFDSEALINDGSSIFLFTFFKSLTRGKTSTWTESLGRFATLLIIGPLFGLISACLMYRWLKHYRWYPYDKTLAVVFASYLVFFIAEIYLQTSGPLAIVVYGLYFKAYAKAAFEADATEVHYHFVKGCATAATSVVFIISGIASLRMMWDAFTSQSNLALPGDLPELEPEAEPSGYSRVRVSSQLWRVPVFYLYLNAARFLMIGVFYPFLRRFLEHFTWKEYLLLSWGGLRGAVCLILALIIEQDDHINQDMSAAASLYIASSAFLILFANGITFEWLYKALKPYKTNAFRQVYLKKVMKLVDKEYFNEISLLQQHWLFERSWALVYADKLVPRLGHVEMDKFGKIHLARPRISRVLRQFPDQELSRALPHQEGTSRLGSPSPPSRQSDHARPPNFKLGVLETEPPTFPLPTNIAQANPISLTQPPCRDLSKGPVQDEATGHTTAAFLQRLRRPPESSLDLEMNLRLLDNEDDDDNVQVMDIISRQQSKFHDEDDDELVPESITLNVDSLDEFTVQRAPSVPPTNVNVSSGQGNSAFRRIPGYRYDSVVRIRSEPYSGGLDAAQLERWQTVFQESSTAEAIPDVIPRAMSVPHNLESLANIENQNAECVPPQPSLAKDREGEMLIMTVNTMRQQYKRMYEQCFISGTVYVGFMSTADIVADFALMDVGNRNRQRVWRDAFSTSDHLSFGGDTFRNAGAHAETPEAVATGFDVEWQVTAARLRANPKRGWRLMKLLKWIQGKQTKTPRKCCKSRRSRTSFERKVASWLRSRWLSLWSVLGPRQTFPALDDLQLICAFVDVHEELLVRGDSGLRTMLGPRLLRAFEAQTMKAKETVERLVERYPNSFPYAMICHAAIFLVNMKIQLVEEQYERGLLLADDKEKISSMLKEQLVSVAKFHPPSLFT